MGFFMLGLPGETLQTAWETVDFAIELNCDFAKFAITIPYPGSRLYDQVAGQVDASQSEKFTSWTDWAGDKGELLYVPDGMTTADLLRVQRLGMLKFYARPQLVYRHLINGTLRPRDMLFGASVLLERAGQTVWDRLR
jgi:magnesium-protoporphyrin IX monomethyl ester (oxidative) cyclase